MRHRDYDKLRAELLDAQGRIAELLRILPELYAELIDGQPGYPTSTTGGGSATLDAAGHPGGLDQFVTQPDQAAEDLRALRRSAIAAANSTRTATDVARRWLPTERVIDPAEPRPRSGGDCIACGIYCSGSVTDRLRSGLCDACRQSWRRWQERSAHEQGSGDRGDWLLTRRRDILAAEA